ncbi:hypothetical protein [Streptomyces sp. NPDC048603]|uniref:hypothetical protein n=1 Tax=Streptomyces sp. NPDC048603 TaxID=3365577 RepID=UPI00371B1EB9
MRLKSSTAVAVLLPVLLLGTAGCGGSDSGAKSGPAGHRPDPKGSAAAPAASAAPGAPPAPRTPLEKAALAQGDLPGYQISAQGKNPNAPDGQPQADKKACQPLADIMGDEPDPTSRETVNRGVGSQKQLGLAVSASISSYGEDDAKRLMGRLREAVAACGTGFSATVEKQTGRYTEVKPATYKADGDETVSWTTVAAAEGVSARVHLVVVREGATVVRLMALNVAGAKTPAEVPHEVTDKQLAKLRGQSR